MRKLNLLFSAILMLAGSATAFGISYVADPEDFQVCPGSNTTAVFSVFPYDFGVKSF